MSEPTQTLSLTEVESLARRAMAGCGAHGAQAGLQAMQYFMADGIRVPFRKRKIDKVSSAQLSTSLLGSRNSSSSRSGSTTCQPINGRQIKIALLSDPLFYAFNCRKRNDSFDNGYCKRVHHSL